MSWRGPAAFAVLGREATRTARRGQTYLVRVAFAALLLIAILYAFQAQLGIIQYDPSQAAKVGHALFKMFIASELLLVLPIAPILVGQAIIEERHDGTLDLLTLTRLTPGSILWSKVSSRLAMVLMLLLSGAPLVSMTVSLGGVGVWEVVNGTSALLLLTLWLGAIGGFAALTARTAIASLVSGAGFGFFILLLSPYLLQVLTVLAHRGPQRPPPWISPFLSITSDKPEALLVWLVALPALVGIGTAAHPTFLMVTSSEPQDEEFGNLSPEIWHIERLKRRTFLIGATWLIASIGLLLLEAAYTLRPSLLLWARVPQASVFFYLLSVGWMFAFQAAHRRFDGLFRRPAREEEPLYLPVWEARWRNLRRRVWPNPVAWREALTLGSGASAMGGRFGALIFLGISTPILILSELDDDVFSLFGLLGIAGGLLLTGLAAMGSVCTERDAGTLTLLQTTTLARGAILRGKLVGMAIQSLPLFALGGAYFYYGAVRTHGRDDLLCFELGLSATPTLLPKLAMTAAWLGASWLAMASVAVFLAMVIRAPAASRTAALAIPLGWYVLPVLAGSTVLGRTGKQLAVAWVPVLSRTWDDAGCAVDPVFQVSIALHLAIALLAMLLTWLFLLRPSG